MKLKDATKEFVTLELSVDEFQKLIDVVFAADQYFEDIDPDVIKLSLEEMENLRDNISELSREHIDRAYSNESAPSVTLR